MPSFTKHYVKMTYLPEYIGQELYSGQVNKGDELSCSILFISAHM